MHSAAVFDLDNTLVRGSSLYHFGRFLVRHRALSTLHVARFALAERRYARGAGERDTTTQRVIQVALGLIAGVSQATMEDLADQFATGMAPRHLEAAMRHEVRRQQDRGVPCFIATASPQELADAFARRFRMDAAFGTTLEVSDGVYTGRLIGPPCHGEAKAQRVRAGLTRRGLHLSTGVAYSDSVNDLPLLASACRPVAVNPDGDLLAIAELNGWTVIRGRRDDRRAAQTLLANLPFPIWQGHP